MKLYGSPGSAAMAPMAVLEHVGAPYDWVRVDLDAGEHQQPEFLALNPKGRVPVLIDGTTTLIDWWHPVWLTRDADAQDAVKAGAEKRIGICFELIDAKLAAAANPYCLGAQLTVVDYFLHMAARWSRYLVTPAYAYPAIKRTTDAVRALPATRRMMEKQAIAEA
jgi:glutathione S-transferase